MNQYLSRLSSVEKNKFFTVISKSPSYCQGSPQFELFLNNFETLYENMKKDNPFAVFFAGDFNGHSQLWWSDGDTTAEGTATEQLTSLMGLINYLKNPLILNRIKTHHV